MKNRLVKMWMRKGAGFVLSAAVAISLCGGTGVAAFAAEADDAAVEVLSDEDTDLTDEDTGVSDEESYDCEVSGHTYVGGVCSVCEDINPDYEWYYEDTDADEFSVSTADELAALADLVNETGLDFEGCTISLEDDISLSGISWEPIASAGDAVYLTITSQEELNSALQEHFIIYDSNSGSYVRGSGKNAAYDSSLEYYYLDGSFFAGTFEGNGYTISDMTVVSDEGCCGLFGQVSGTIRNFTVTGTITNNATNADYVGGACGRLAPGGTISGVTADVAIYAYVSSSQGCYNVGGVVGMVGEPGMSVYTDENVAVVEQCVNLGYVAGYVRVGGIAGRNAGIIRQCANFGEVYNASAAKKGTGGIVGMNGVNNDATDAGLVEDCYNAGYVDGNGGYWTGGIVGFQNSLSLVQNCYNSAELGIYRSTGAAWSWSNPGIGQNEGTAINIYGVDSVVGSDGSTTVGNSGGTVTNCIFYSESEMKSSSFADILNGEDGTVWVADDTAAVNGGYAILSFQEPKPTVLYGGEEITEGGKYQLDTTAVSSTIYIMTTDEVEIIGNGAEFDDEGTMTSTANTELYFDASASEGVHLTFRDVYISNKNGSAPILDLDGENNEVSFEGTNVLDADYGYNMNAAIHVAAGDSLTIKGSGTLYLYKSSQGAGIGGNSNTTASKSEMNGEITFAMTGSAFIKGTKQGAVIGAGSGASSSDSVPGAIIFESGTYNLISNSRGAVIGGSAGSTGGSTGTTVYIMGGLININVDYSGAAVGGGGYDAGNDSSGGTMFVTGGSLRVYVDTNAANNATTGWQGRSFYAGVNDAAITAQRLNMDGEEVHWLQFNTSELSEKADTYSVSIDGEDFYEGGNYEYYFIQETLDKNEQHTITSTPSNWVKMSGENQDYNLYFWVATGMETVTETDEETGEETTVREGDAAVHTVTVNGESFEYVWNEEDYVFDPVTEDDADYNGLYEDEDGVLAYYVDGVIDTSYTGVAASEDGTVYYVESGYVGSYTGLAKDTSDGTWYYFTESVLNENYTGLVKNAANEICYYVADGTIDWSYTGPAKYAANDCWYYVADGTIDWTFTGLAKNAANDCWYYFASGALDWSYTGAAKNSNGIWYYVANGQLDWTFSGTVTTDNGTFTFKNGTIVW